MSDDIILLVDDDPAAIRILGRILADTGHLRFATNGVDGLRVAREAKPDLIVLDADMPGMSGFQVCEALKADPQLAEVPVIFVTSHAGQDFEISGFAHGAADFIAKPVSAPLVLARVKTQLRVKRLTDELRQLTRVDALTGVANRRHFDDTLANEWRRARRGGDALSLLMIDVDHFKLFNDRYGHPAGDVCLRAVAQALGAACRRPADLLARYGGEEFALLLPLTPRAGAERVALRVLGAVDALALAHEASPTSARVSVSVGVGCYDDQSACWREACAPGETQLGQEVNACAADLLAAADRALYAAKHAGRARAAWLDVADAEGSCPAREIAAPR